MIGPDAMAYDRLEKTLAPGAMNDSSARIPVVRTISADFSNQTFVDAYPRQPNFGLTDQWSGPSRAVLLQEAAS
jgi:hypothetical protein